jgi:hypothetical protein
MQATRGMTEQECGVSPRPGSRKDGRSAVTGVSRDSGDDPVAKQKGTSPLAPRPPVNQKVRFSLFYNQGNKGNQAGRLRAKGKTPLLVRVHLRCCIARGSVVLRSRAKHHRSSTEGAPKEHRRRDDERERARAWEAAGRSGSHVFEASK